jgi:hypothetical protein
MLEVCFWLCQVKGLLVGSEFWAEMTVVVVFASLVARKENSMVRMFNVLTEGYWVSLPGHDNTVCCHWIGCCFSSLGQL